MLRLSGAIQVLEEELAVENAPEHSNNLTAAADNHNANKSEPIINGSHNGAEPGASVLSPATAALPVE